MSDPNVQFEEQPFTPRSFDQGKGPSHDIFYIILSTLFILVSCIILYRTYLPYGPWPKTYENFTPEEKAKIPEEFKIIHDPEYQPNDLQ